MISFTRNDLASTAPAKAQTRLSESAGWSRRDTWCGILLAAIAVVTSAMSVTGHPVGVLQDDGMYVVLARSIVEGEGYRFSNLPNAPYGTHYPPLYPLWLALLWKLSPSFPANIQLFKLANSILLGAAVAGVFVFARRRLGFGPWAAVAASAAGAAPLVGLSALVLSEPAFLAALFPVLLLAERAAPGTSARSAVAVGAAAGALGLIRSLGMFVLPAVVLILVMQRRWRHAGLALLAGALVLGPWQFWTLAHAGELPPALLGKYGSYFGWVWGGIREGGFAFVAAVLKTNVELTAAFFTGSLGLAGTHWLLRAVAVVLLLGLMVVGARELWHRAPVSAVFFATYIGVVMLWPYPPHRFYWGIMPLIAFTGALGIRYCLAIAAGQHWALRCVAVVTAASLCALFAWPNSPGKPRWALVEEMVADRSRAVAEWVSRNSGTDDIIATEDEVLVHLYTGRRAIPLVAFTPQEHVRPQTTAFASATLDTLLRTYPIRWVLPVSTTHINTALALTGREPAVLSLRHGLTLGAVFEHVRAAGSGRGTGAPVSRPLVDARARGAE